MYSSVNSDSDEDYFDTRADVNPSGEIIVEELKRLNAEKEQGSNTEEPSIKDINRTVETT